MQRLKPKLFFKTYYTALEEVDDFSKLPNDAFLKFSFNTPEEKTVRIVEELNQQLGDKVAAVSSGHGNIDVIGKGVTKGTALSYLLDKWQLEPDQLMVFGDSNNDLEMLRLTVHSYAMMNASDQVKETAHFVTMSNNDSGVLSVMEKELL